MTSLDATAAPVYATKKLPRDARSALLEKYARQVLIEAETMVLMARQLILPAALEQQKRISRPSIACSRPPK